MLNLFFCLLAYLVFGMVVTIYSRSIGNLFFVWNVFLALLPFLLSQILIAYLARQEKNRLVIVLLGFSWLVFFPNAPYMITDLIYLGGSGYYNVGDASATNAPNIYHWTLLVYISLGVVFAALSGLRSQYDIHMLLRERFGKNLSTAVMAAVCLLSGFGIYIGRFLRLNSWDVLRPVSLLVRLREDLSSVSFLYSLLFSAYIAASYIVFYILITAASNSANTDSSR